MNNLDPSWPAFSCTSRHVNGNDKQRPILFEVWDYESSGSHQMIGHFTTTLYALEAGEVREGKLLHPQGKKKDVGTLVFESVVVEKSYSFCDYLMGGCEVSLMAAVDFTASNGDPRQPGTLHHTSPHAKNEYEQAIESVGGIVVAYDHDGLVPSYGEPGRSHASGLAELRCSHRRRWLSRVRRPLPEWAGVALLCAEWLAGRLMPRHAGGGGGDAQLPQCGG